MWPEKLDLIQALGPLLTSVLTWVISRAKAKIDRFFDDIEAREKEIKNLYEQIGKLKMINEAQWRNIEDMKTRIQKLEDTET